MILENTPRLATSRSPFWLGVALLAAYWVLVDVIEPSDGTMVILVGSLDGAILVLMLIQNMRRRIRLRRNIAVLRSLSDASRSDVLSGLRGEPVAGLLEREVSWHGRPEVEALVERFKFSPTDQRETRMMMWALSVGAVVAVLPVAGASIPFWGKIGAATLAVTFGVMGARMSIRCRELERWFEVSPFGLAEIQPGVGVRRVLWEMPLMLRNNQRTKRLELSVHGEPDHIEIPYTLIQLERLVQLILEKGSLAAEPPNVPLQPTSGAAGTSRIDETESAARG